MKKDIRSNREYSNSKGISSKEYRLGSNAGRPQNRSLQQDFDYLDKLSPEEFAFLAEFNSNFLSGEYADENVVGEEVAAKMNTRESKRDAQNAENARRRSVENRQHLPIDEAILEHVDTQNQQRWMDADANIERFWKEKRKKATYEKLKGGS